MKESRGHHRPGHGKGGQGRGPSSIWLHDPELIFSSINLKRGETLLDLGCGPGDYSVLASQIVGESGRVYALDGWEPMIAGLDKRAAAEGLRNIRTVIADIVGPVPIEDGSVDVCLISTVLHIIDRDRDGPSIFREVHRVLKPDGRLAIIECKKEEQNWGPPLEFRLAPEDVEETVGPQGFVRTGLVDLGKTYLIQFRLG